MNTDNAYDSYSNVELKKRLRMNGWSDAEETLLNEAAEQCRRDGMPLRSAFAAVARATGRQPNSVRNHYYIKLKEKASDGCVQNGAFVPFTDDEVDMLMRTILTATANGESVRSCTLRMGNGDNRAMLRYQNKYRAILKKDPELVRRIMKKLETEGINARDPYAARREIGKGTVGTVKAVFESEQIYPAPYDYAAISGSNSIQNDEREEAVLNERMLSSVASAAEKLANLDGFNAELLFRSLAALADSAGRGGIMQQKDKIESDKEEFDASKILNGQNGSTEHATPFETVMQPEPMRERYQKMYRLLKELVSLNYDFLNKSGVSRLAYLTEYITKLSKRVAEYEQLMLELKSEVGSKANCDA